MAAPGVRLQSPPVRRLALFASIGVAAVLVAYSNHFHNSFHFDDDTVIQNNAYLRSLKNIPLFFRDGTTFSSLPANAAYRPSPICRRTIPILVTGG